MKLDFSPYAHSPKSFRGNIPVFVDDDLYVRNYDEIARDQLKSLESTGHNGFMEDSLWQMIEEVTRSMILKYRDAYTPASGTVKFLDAGVGLGRVLESLPSAFDKFGTDVSSELLERAVKKGFHVCKAQLEALPYRDSAFDAVLCTDVLEHVVNLHKACLELKRVLRPGGILFVRVPFEEDLSDYLRSDFPYHLCHLRNFDLPSLQILFEKVLDMKLLEVKLCGPLPHRHRVRLPLPESIRAGISVGIKAVRPISKNLFRMLCSLFFRASEINLVVQK